MSRLTPKLKSFTVKEGGTFTTVETNIDTDGDGNSAVIDQGVDVCNIGSFAFQEEIEVIPRPVTSACPAGTTDESYIDATHGQHRVVATDEKTGDQLFAQVTSGTFVTISHLILPFLSRLPTQCMLSTLGAQENTPVRLEPLRVTVLGATYNTGLRAEPAPFGGFGEFTFSAERYADPARAGTIKKTDTDNASS